MYQYMYVCKLRRSNLASKQLV